MVLRDAGIVDGQPAQPLHVVQDALTLSYDRPAVPIIDRADTNRITNIVLIASPPRRLATLAVEFVDFTCSV